MTNKEILTKAIEKAIAGGWTTYGVYEKDWYLIPAWSVVTDDGSHYHVYQIIFNHGFAKSLWGEENLFAVPKTNPGWQYHLQRMVIADDPIKYLGENI